MERFRVSIRQRLCSLSTALATLMVLALFATGCDSDGDPDDSDVPDYATIQLEPGRSYTYAWTSTLVVVDFDGVLISESSMRDTVLVDILPTVSPVVGANVTHQLEAYQKGHYDERAVTWYERTDEELRVVAYGGDPGYFVVPKRFSALRLSPKLPPISTMHPVFPFANSWSDVPEDSIRLAQNPRVVLKAPLDIGQSWVSFTTDNLTQRREVILSGLSSGPGGAFNVLVVESTYEPPNDTATIVDYLATIGLVRRVFETTGESRDDQNIPNGTYTLEDELELLQTEVRQVE